MKQDPPTLSDELRAHQGTSLDEAFLTRLTGSAVGTWTELTREEAQYEAFLRQTAPARLEHDFITRLEATTRGVHFNVSEKIVLFPKEGGSGKNSNKLSTWAAAAAVALIAAGSAFMLPSKNVLSASSQAPLSSSLNLNNFVPASFNRGLSAVHDEGVVWKDNKLPQRLLRFVYTEKTTYKDANGRTVEVEQPKAHYTLLPEKTD